MSPQQFIDAAGIITQGRPTIMVHTTTYDPDGIVDGELGPDARTTSETYTFDAEWDDDPITWAAELLTREGITEPSCAPTWAAGTWYVGRCEHYGRVGTDAQFSAHLDGFSADAERAIYARVTA